MPTRSATTALAGPAACGQGNASIGHLRLASQRSESRTLLLTSKYVRKRRAPARRATTAGPLDRKREAVLHDFRKVAGPLRGQNRDRKPKS